MKLCKPTARTALAALAILAASAVQAQTPAGSVVYRCPGNVYTSDRDINAKQAADRGCRSLEGAPITVLQTVKPRAAAAGSAAASGARSPEGRVDPADQRSRDSEARRILDGELRKEQERLSMLQKDYNNGQPERQGDERNYQKYLDRVAAMKAEIARKEADIAALKQELAKLPP